MVQKVPQVSSCNSRFVRPPWVLMTGKGPDPTDVSLAGVISTHSCQFQQSRHSHYLASTSAGVVNFFVPSGGETNGQFGNQS